MLTVTLDLSEFHTLVGRTLDELEHGLQVAVAHAATEGANEAKANPGFQDRTGNLRSNIQARRVASGRLGETWEIVSPMPYSRFVDEGTRPHMIYPRNASVLHWEDADGAHHFAKAVHHPGTRGTGFMGSAYLKAERRLYAEIDTILHVLERVWTAQAA